MYDTFCEVGEFSYNEFEDDLSGKLESFRGPAFRGYVRAIAKDTDSKATRERPANQPFLPGVTWDLEGVLALGNGRRIAKRLAQIEHADAAMAIRGKNVAAVVQAYALDQQEMALLRAYWNKPDVTKAHAVEAYKRDHPDSEAA